MNDLLNEIASEGGEGFSGDMEYREKKTFDPPVARYQVLNPSPQAAPGAPFEAGIRMTTFRVMGETKEKSFEVTQSVRAVILYTSSARELGSGQGKNFSIKCQSHDGIKPSLRIDQPLCRTATGNDVAQIMSQWKGYDKAKVDAAVSEVVNDDGKLKVCGLKSANGAIVLCPFGRRNPITGQAAACKQKRYVRLYDIERKREFEMVLTGKSDTFSQKFISPFHEFMRYLRTAGPKDANGKPKGLPSFAFVVNLSVAKDGNFYYLNVSDWKPIEKQENRAQMLEKAHAAKENYDKQASRLSKAAYEAKKQAETATRQAAQNGDLASTIPSSDPTPGILALGSAASRTAASRIRSDAEPDAGVSFEDDDINF